MTGAAVDEARLAEQGRVKADERRDPVDAELSEGAKHAGPRGLPRRIVDDQLRDHGVVQAGDPVSRTDAGVDAHPRAGRLLSTR